MSTAVIPGAEAFRFDGGQLGALLQHGFTGCPASMRPIGEWLARRGVSVIGPRLPGHGTSWEDMEKTSWQDWVRESEAALADLSSRCSTVVIVGQSMGGTIALLLGAEHPDKLNGVVVINPIVRKRSLVFASVVRPFVRTVKAIGGDIKKPGQDEIFYDRTPLASAAQLGRLLRVVWRGLPSMRLPLLVFSSTEDHLVDPVNSRLVMSRAGSGRKDLIRLTNSYHVAALDNDAELICESVLRFANSLARETYGRS